MPAKSELLAQIFRIANESVPIAIGWHVVAAVVVIALVAGWRPSIRAAGALVALPMLSVSALAWIHGNPVNGTVFLFGAAALLALGLTHGAGVTEPGPRWARLAGVAAIALGWIYPHFVVVGSPVELLWAAPLGVLPCPTLSLLVGVALLGGGLGSPPLSAVLAGMGLFYGVIGVVALGVLLDAGLLVAALALAVLVAHHSWQGGAAARRPRAA
jgi:hypothetical protein